MSTPFVTFPNTATDFLFTNDVNLLDASTAHTASSIGFWNNRAGTKTLTHQTVSGAYGGKVLQFLSSTSGNNVSVRTQPRASSVTVSSSTQYTASVKVRGVGNGGSRTFKASIEWGNGAAYVGEEFSGAEVAAADNEWVTITCTGTSPATADNAVVFIQVRNAAAADEIYQIDTSCLTQGASAPFVPSLNVVGTLFEEKSESGITATLAAGVLTVGKSWGGDGYYYRRYDGADNTAPLVCEFLAADVLAAL